MKKEKDTIFVSAARAGLPCLKIAITVYSLRQQLLLIHFLMLVPMKNLSQFLLACLLVSCSSSTEPEPEPIPPMLIIHIDIPNDDVEQVGWRLFKEGTRVARRNPYETDCINHTIDTVQRLDLIGIDAIQVYEVGLCDDDLPSGNYWPFEQSLSIQEGDTVHVYATGLLEEQ